MSATVEDAVLERDATWTDVQYAEALEAEHGWSAEQSEAYLLELEGERTDDPGVWFERADWHEREGNHRRSSMCAGYGNHLRERASAEDEAEASKSESLRQEAGEPVGPMPPAPAPEPIAPDQLVLTGAWGMDTATKGVDGKKPTRSTLTVKMPPKVTVDGAYKKGERVRLQVEALVTFVGDEDVLDRTTKQVTDCVHVQKGVALDVRLVEADE